MKANGFGSPPYRVHALRHKEGWLIGYLYRGHLIEKFEGRWTIDDDWTFWSDIPTTRYKRMKDAVAAVDESLERF